MSRDNDHRRRFAAAPRPSNHHSPCPAGGGAESTHHRSSPFSSAGQSSGGRKSPNFWVSECTRGGTRRRRSPTPPRRRSRSLSSERPTKRVFEYPIRRSRSRSPERSRRRFRSPDDSGCSPPSRWSGSGSQERKSPKFGSGYISCRRTPPPHPRWSMVSDSGRRSRSTSPRRRTPPPRPRRSLSHSPDGRCRTQRRSPELCLNSHSGPSSSSKGKGRFQDSTFHQRKDHSGSYSFSVKGQGDTCSSPPSRWLMSGDYCPPPSSSKGTSFRRYPALAPALFDRYVPSPAATYIEIFLTYAPNFHFKERVVNPCFPMGRRLFSLHCALARYLNSDGELKSLGCEANTPEYYENLKEYSKCPEHAYDFERFWHPLSAGFVTVDEFLEYQWGRHGKYLEIECERYLAYTIVTAKGLIRKLEALFDEHIKENEVYTDEQIDNLVKTIHSGGTRVKPTTDHQGRRILYELKFLFVKNLIGKSWSPAVYPSPARNVSDHIIHF